MKERIARQITQRTEMLAGVSHDLRTPITRIKLQLALMKPSEEIDEVLADIKDMEHMIEHYLDFVRGGEKEKSSYEELGPIMQQIIEFYYNQDIPVDLVMDPSLRAHIKMSAFKRMIKNLLNNAARYARAIRISISRDATDLTLIIEDDGPGISPEQYKLVFKPFYRIDNSRNLDKDASVGLGLAIVRDIVHSHGGKISLDKSEQLGGLKVVITIPV
jgi:two-component system osmolarity sensor histidine kinase EnvZ